MIAKYHESIISKFRVQIQEKMKNNEDARWPSDLPSLKYLLLYIIENVEVKNKNFFDSFRF